MILANGTVVAVMDGARLRLFRNRGREPDVDLVEEPALALDAGDAGSGGRHRSSTANPDRSRLREDAFAVAVARHLNEEVLAGRIGSLVIVADARTLGELRKHVHHDLASRLSGEIAKDLAGRPLREIEQALRTA